MYPRANCLTHKACDSNRWDIFKWEIIHEYRIQSIFKIYKEDKYNSEYSSGDDKHYYLNIPQTVMTCTFLAGYGQWNLLKFAREELQCEIGTHTFRRIVMGGDLSIIKWAH